MMESIKHVLWSCPKIKQLWKSVLRLMIYIHANCVMPWGPGCCHVGHSRRTIVVVLKEYKVEAFHINPPLVQMVQPFLIDRLQIRDDIIWKTIPSILSWLIWKARCASFIA